MVVARIRFAAKTFLGSHPQLYLPIARRRMVASPFSDETDLVIEGFPRSGNTFAVAAFEASQPRAVAVAHHEHVPAQVLAAVRKGVPTLVLIRAPEESILSFLVQQPQFAPGQSLHAYRVFYERLEPVRAGFLLATFESVTSDFGAVTRRLNERFGTDFEEFEHTAENVQRVLRIMEEDNRRRFGEGETLDRVGALPSSARSRLKDSLRDAYRSDGLTGARARADAVYERLVASADA